MGKPILLTKTKLIQPIEQALIRIKEIEQREIIEDKIVLEGIFVLAVSSFEYSLNDTLRVLLNFIPDKLDIKTESIPKNDLVNGNPLELAIENKILSVSYKSLPDILNYFAVTTGIDKKQIDETELNSLLEIKATRNLLLHNNLVINNIYKNTAGPNIRKPNNGNKKLSIDKNYLLQSLKTIKQVLKKIKTALLDKYASYTNIEAVKRLFQYIFKTPIMVFEKEFEIDDDQIVGFKFENSAIDSLSTSERFFYDIWLAHSSGKYFQFKPDSIYHLDNNNIEKLKYFISALELLKS
jgi:hypothetical protein